MNSVHSSPSGKLYGGNYGFTHCDINSPLTFYRYTEKAGLKEIASHFESTSASIAVGNTIYHLDGCAQNVTAYDRDPISGDLSKFVKNEP